MTAPWKALLALWLLLGLAAQARPEEPWPDPGPPSSRDLFPLNLIPLTYRPLGADTVGRGQWRLSFQVIRSNTFEFSDLIKDRLGRDSSGRFAVDQAGTARFAATLPDEPLVFFFDAEIQRTEFSARYGLTGDTDLGVTVGWQGTEGGFMDGLIEGFHKLGFEQTGRSAIARDQFTFAIIQHGRVVHFSQTAVRARPVDPVVAVVHRLSTGPTFTLSLLGALQLPMTSYMGGLRSDWDSSAGLAFQWRPAPGHAVNGGGAYLRRGLRGGAGPNPFLIKDQIAGHLGWEWQGWRRIRPFVLLLYHDALTSQGPGATLDKPSVIHDLGMHLRLGPRSALTLSYLNNLTHHENTADMGLALRLCVRP